MFPLLSQLGKWFFFSWERSGGWSNGGWLCTFTSHLKQSRVSLTLISGFYLLKLVRGMHVITVWLMWGKQGNIPVWFLSCLKHTYTHWGTLFSCFLRSAIATLIKRQLHFRLYNKKKKKIEISHSFSIPRWGKAYRSQHYCTCLMFCCTGVHIGRLDQLPVCWGGIF